MKTRTELCAEINRLNGIVSALMPGDSGHPIEVGNVLSSQSGKALPDKKLFNCVYRVAGRTWEQMVWAKNPEDAKERILAGILKADHWTFELIAARR